MEQKIYNRKVAKPAKKAPTHRVDISMNIRIDEAVKKRFTKALRVGRPATITDTVENLMTAYADRVEADGQQPEFPLEVRSRSVGNK